MQDVRLELTGVSMDYARARAIANAVAGTVESEPVLLAWHDKPQSRMGPDIAGADVETRWHDYGESYGGKLEVSVNGDYDFIFRDSTEFNSPGADRDPYVTVVDEKGRKYLCYRDAVDHGDTICEPVDEMVDSEVGG